MDHPTPAQLRQDPRWPWATLGAPPPPPEPDILYRQIDTAWSYVELVTTRDLEALPEPDISPVGETAEDVNLALTAQEAVTLRVVQQLAEVQSLVSGGDWSSVTGGQGGAGFRTSMAVPGYSESRQAGGSGSAASTGRRGVDWLYTTWLPLDRLLVALTPVERLDDILVALGLRPQSGVVAFTRYPDNPVQSHIEQDVWLDSR